MCSLRDLVDELLHAQVKTKLFGGDHAPKLGRLVLLDRGRVVAEGTHHDLLARSSRYRAVLAAAALGHDGPLGDGNGGGDGGDGDGDAGVTGPRRAEVGS